MDYIIEEVEQDVWRVNVAGITRIVRHRGDSRTFAPWDVTTVEGRKLWSAASLESAFRWIQARTGQPVEALFAQALLERRAPSSTSRLPATDESAQGRKTGLPT